MAKDLVTLLVELVVVARDVAHQYHTLDNRILQLHEYAPLAQARNLTIELLANLVGHKLHHLVLDGCSLGLGSYHLALGAAHAQRFVHILVGRTLAIEVALQQTMHHHIGIASDR